MTGTEAGLGIAVPLGDFGVMSNAQLDAEFATYAALGVEWVRTDLWWNLVQAAGPDSFNWRDFDRVFTAAHTHGVDLLPVLGRVPTWASASEDANAFGRFAAEAARRYGPQGITTWEIWNEPNMRSHWGGAPDPVVYARLLTEAYDAIKAVDPDATVLSGGLAAVPTTDTSAAPRYMAATEFLEAVYAAGRDTDFFDGVAFHPYTWPYMPSHSASWSGWTIMTGTSASIRSVMSSHGDGDKTVWMTEYGAPTGGSTQAVSEQKQAIMLLEAAGLPSTVDWDGPLFWYSLRDRGQDPASVESWFGLTTSAGVPKIGYDFLKDVLQFGASSIPGTTVESSVSRTLTSGEGKLALVGSAPVNGTGNSAANIIVGNHAANVIRGELGDDILHGAGGADQIDGGGGADRLYGASGGDKIVGGDGADVLFGGGDNDLLLAGWGTDTFYGGTGLDTASYADLSAMTAALDNSLTTTGSAAGDHFSAVENLSGSSFADWLRGGNRANVLSGGAGDDTIEGLGGDDRIVGGSGRDWLSGGAGADEFDYASVSDSAPGAADQITGFVKGSDDLVLTGIDANTTLTATGNQAFVLDTNGSFSVGEIRQTQQGANLLIEGNTDGDSNAELMILLLNVTGALASSDFEM